MVVLATVGVPVQKRRRLDDVCVELAPQYSKNVIQSFILSGKVFVDDQKVTKAGHQVSTLRPPPATLRVPCGSACHALAACHAQPDRPATAERRTSSASWVRGIAGQSHA
jgi:S4 domain